MAYNYSYINRYDESTGISYTLILEDQDGIMPLIRNQKYFAKKAFSNLQQKDLDIEAQKDITLYTQNYQDEITLEQTEEDEQVQYQDTYQSLVDKLQDAVNTKDTQTILDSVYGLLKNKDGSLDDDLVPVISVLESAKVVQDPLNKDNQQVNQSLDPQQAQLAQME